ncbi:MAG: M48 family metallopeptidase [Rubellimicrobium sp.]|nr:M48 family metallopeptidase [Rubellimicrobium sp.]
MLGRGARCGKGGRAITEGRGRAPDAGSGGAGRVSCAKPRWPPQAGTTSSPVTLSLRPLAVSVVLALTAACAPAVAPAPQRPVAMAPAQAPAPGVDLHLQARTFVATVARVEPVAEQECRTLSRAPVCDFRIVVDDRPGMPANAFQTRDEAGRPVIALTLALIAEVANADELAFVLSHEAAHHILGHLDRQNRNAMIGAAALGQLAQALGTSDPGTVRQMQDLGAAVGARTYSQDYELEADRLGTAIALRAGFDPLVGAAFFARIPDPGNRFLGTHPPNSARINAVRQTLAALGR